ncbi:MAG: hypothetical protein WCT16_04880 [Candidatus Buchananbacteria bacterium]
MENEPVTLGPLSIGQEAFGESDLLRRAMEFKGLEFGYLHSERSGASSQPIKEYTLDDKLLAVLASQGIKQQARPDCRGEIFTLVDKNPQEKNLDFAPSNFWNFELVEGQGRKFDLRVSLQVSCYIHLKKRGIVLRPVASGCYVSASDRLPNWRMFKALVESDESAPSIAKELALSDGEVLVTWTDLDLGGIRTSSDLFAEFSNGRRTIGQLASLNIVFDPPPYLTLWQRNQWFITEPAQSKLFQVWRQQLDDYRSSLIV